MDINKGGPKPNTIVGPTMKREENVMSSQLHNGVVLRAEKGEDVGTRFEHMEPSCVGILSNSTATLVQRSK